MTRTTRPGLVLGLVALVAAACGGGTDDQITDDTIPDVEEITETTDVDAAPDGDEQSPDGSPEAVELTPQQQLLAAFSNLGEGRGFRATSTTGQTYRVPALGVDTEQPLDPSRPMVRTDVATNGDSHMVVDVSMLLVAQAGGGADAEAMFDGAGFEVWMVGDQMFIDATGYQVIADLSPDYPLGPFEPGLGVVDLVRVGDLGGEDLVEGMTGTSSVNPISLAATLPASLEGVEQDPDDQNTFRATVPYPVLLEAQGDDVDTMARSIAVGLAPALDTTVDDLAAFYADFFAGVMVDVEFTVLDGVLVSMSTSADLSGVYDALFDDGSFLGDQMSADELAEGARIFADAEQIAVSYASFELDDTLTITPPDGPFEDRTEVAAAFFSQMLPS